VARKACLRVELSQFRADARFAQRSFGERTAWWREPATKCDKNFAKNAAKAAMWGSQRREAPLSADGDAIGLGSGGTQKMLEPRLALLAGARTKNRLLAALPHETRAGLEPHLKTVSLSRGKVLCEVDEPLSHVYFVEHGAVSLVTVFEDGTSAEMATVGREGVVGIGTVLGGEHALGCYVVALPGSAVALDVARFRHALRETPTLRPACEAYAQAFLAHLLQNVACNAAHSVEQRCARWLLMCADQTEDGTFALTQEYLAEMLGVRRSTVTVVACTLQDAGLIGYRRGSITVRDRRGLEAAACECYRIVRNRYDRLLVRACG
jgi:CRP-like cAMP-binding protein